VKERKKRERSIRRRFIEKNRAAAEDGRAGGGGWSERCGGDEFSLLRIHSGSEVWKDFEVIDDLNGSIVAHTLRLDEKISEESLLLASKLDK
jgi:hypothetical protein